MKMPSAPTARCPAAQVGYDTAEFGDFKFEASAAYYDYTLGSVVGADTGDFRSNLRKADGSYLSDFDLGDFLVGATWYGPGFALAGALRWRLREKLRRRNLGRDTGYGMDLGIGRPPSRMTGE